MTLREEQDWFARAVMTGNGSDVEQADRRLTAGPKLGPRERLEVYRRGYGSRLVECLADDYPVLKVALGSDAFDALGRAYVAKHPSESPSLNAYGRHMAVMCEGFASDLARLEWAMVEVVHEKAEPPMTMESLAAIPAEKWGEAHLVASNALRVLTLGYPANDYFQAVRDGGAPTVPGAGASATAVYRSGPTVWRMGLTPAMHRVLNALARGEPLQQALSLAEGETPEQVTAWFREWVSSGLFVAVEVS